MTWLLAVMASFVEHGGGGNPTYNGSVYTGDHTHHPQRTVHRCLFYSETLDELIRLQVTTSALRTIDKKGGLDNYILSMKVDDLGSKALRDLRKALAKAKESNDDMREAEVVEVAIEA